MGLTCDCDLLNRFQTTMDYQTRQAIQKCSDLLLSATTPEQQQISISTIIELFEMVFTIEELSPTMKDIMQQTCENDIGFIAHLIRSLAQSRRDIDMRASGIHYLLTINRR